MSHILATPKFYRNLEDDTHCLQVCIKMAIESLEPYCSFSQEEIDSMTGFITGKATWPMKSYVEIYNLGYDVRVIENFNYPDFANDPDKYLRKEFGNDIAEQVCQESDIASAVRDTHELLEIKDLILSTKLPILKDIAELLSRGYLLICNVNHNLLLGESGYEGHFVLLYEINSNAVTLHDPGPPAKQSLCVSIKSFEDAWSSPNEMARIIFAIGSCKLREKIKQLTA